MTHDIQIQTVTVSSIDNVIWHYSWCGLWSFWKDYPGNVFPGIQPTGKQNKNQLLLFQPDLEKHVFCVNIHHPIHHPGSFKSLPAYNASQLPTEKALGGRKQLEMPPEVASSLWAIVYTYSPEIPYWNGGPDICAFQFVLIYKLSYHVSCPSKILIVYRNNMEMWFVFLQEEFLKHLT